MKYMCCDELRRQELRERKTLNGIDFLEVMDDPSIACDKRQRTLLIYFIFDKSLGSLTAANLKIEGGTRIRNVKVEWSYLGNSLPANLLSADEARFLPDSADDLKRLLVVRTNSNGDYSRYTLRIIRDPLNPDDIQPPADFDPILSAVDFSFKAACESDFDCLTKRKCPPEAVIRPDIDYLAKDYASFRRLMLDRLALLTPQWQEKTPADIGLTFVEWLAYVADYLSYRQDAVATEAYLATARRRISIKRHVRLVDYNMHDGCNARTWIQVKVQGDAVSLEKGTRFLTRSREEKDRIPSTEFSASKTLAERRIVFESMDDAVLYEKHNSMSLYAWGNKKCCLPTGATRATLKGHLPDLKAGDILVFAEIKDPRTGQEKDADPSRRHAVRLTHVASSEAKTPNKKSTDPLYKDEITEIEWAAEDALPFPFCLSGITDESHGSKDVEDASIALGNIILADHGLTYKEDQIFDGEIGEVPKVNTVVPRTTSQDRCAKVKPKRILPRFRPSLKEKPLNFSVEQKENLFFEFVPKMTTSTVVADQLTKNILPGELKAKFDGQGVSFKANRLSVQGSAGEWSVSDGACFYLIRLRNNRFGVLKPPLSAAGVRQVTLDSALPSLTLVEKGKTADGPKWQAVRDLLKSGKEDRDFVVEVDNDGTAFIRFGDKSYGDFPDKGVKFKAIYRVGNGTAGNIGAEALAHVVSDDSRITSVKNPLPAAGGKDPEVIERVRQRAPFAFRRQERAVTAEDYAEAAKRHPQVQNAVATFRWTGSWHTVFLTIDRVGGLPVDSKFQDKMRTHIEKYRLAGYDLVIDSPRYVSLEIEMLACVKPGFFREDVKEALLDLFSRYRLADGRLGVFHPDYFTFGQPVYLSRIYEAALSVDGVQSVNVSKFQRQEDDVSSGLKEGKLAMGRLEIARLDNDPNYPDHGVLRIQMGGGQ